MQSKLSPTLTLRSGIAAYADWHSLRGSSTQHQRDTRQRLLALSELLPEDASVSDVTRAHCISLLRQLQRDGRKPSTQVAYYRVLDAFFHWLMDEGYLTESPMRRVPKPKLPQEQIKPLTEDELQRLLSAPDRSTFVGLRDCLCIAVLADTGLRISEALQQRIGDVDTRQRSFAVLGKGGKTRTVFFGEAVAGVLRDYLKKRQGATTEELLFVNSLGEPLWKCTISKRLRDQRQADLLPVLPHIRILLS